MNDPEPINAALNLKCHLYEKRIAALEEENARLQADYKRVFDLALEHFGLIITIGSWLEGDLPEATEEQFIELCDKAQTP